MNLVTRVDGRWTRSGTTARSTRTSEGGAVGADPTDPAAEFRIRVRVCYIAPVPENQTAPPRRSRALAIAAGAGFAADPRRRRSRAPPAGCARSRPRPGDLRPGHRGRRRPARAADDRPRPAPRALHGGDGPARPQPDPRPGPLQARPRRRRGEGGHRRAARPLPLQPLAPGRSGAGRAPRGRARPRSASATGRGPPTSGTSSGSRTARSGREKRPVELTTRGLARRGDHLLVALREPAEERARTRTSPCSPPTCSPGTSTSTRTSAPATGWRWWSRRSSPTASSSATARCSPPSTTAPRPAGSASSATPTRRARRATSTTTGRARGAGFLKSPLKYANITSRLRQPEAPGPRLQTRPRGRRLRRAHRHAGLGGRRRPGADRRAGTAAAGRRSPCATATATRRSTATSPAIAVSAGKPVAQKQIIGCVGETGLRHRPAPPLRGEARRRRS